MIRAANSITGKPYKWGGGHGRWYDSGYDCSGATSFVLRTGGFASWGVKCAGSKGLRWRASVRPTGRFKLRHPVGL